MHRIGTLLRVDRFVASVRFVTSWGAVAAVVLLVVAGCSNGDDDGGATTTTERRTTTTTTAPERQASTTTTAYDQTAIEGQVEAAYLRSWDVYADAVYHLQLDEQALAEVYAEEGLENIRAEIEGRIVERRAAHVAVDHNYQVVITNEAIASVIDQIVNHQILIDPETKEPLEPDPNDRQVLNFVMRRIGDTWKVTRVERVDQ
jgi:hypothetical protein